jgi:drug/metabolite transporter (DMT)-like permease
MSSVQSDCVEARDTTMEPATVGSQTFLYVLLVVTMLLWGGTWPIGRVVSQTVNPWNAAFIRFFLASGPLILLCMKMEGRRALVVHRRYFFRLILLGLTGIFGYSAFFFKGLQTTGAARGALIIGSIPASIALSSALVMGERLRWFGVIGILTALAGVGTVISHGSPVRLLEGSLEVGDLLLLGCVACWTLYTLIGKPVMKELSPLVVVTWSCIIGTILIAPFAFASGVIETVKIADARLWWSLAYLAICGTSLAYYWYYYALNRLGPMRTSIFINLVPIFGVTFGCLALNETLPLSLLAGGTLVIAGVTLTLRAGKPKAESSI